MGNCLVTKLKASVSNPTLRKLGELRLCGVNIEQGRHLVWIGALVNQAETAIVELENATVNVNNPGRIDGTHYYAPLELGGLVDVEKGVPFTAKILDKYKIIKLFNENSENVAYLPEDFSELAYVPTTEIDFGIVNNGGDNFYTYYPNWPVQDLNDFLINFQYKATLQKFAVYAAWSDSHKFIVDLANFAGYSALTHLDIQQNIAEGNIASLASLTNLQTLSLRGLTNLTGDIASLGTLTQLKAIDIMYCGTNGKVYGSLEGFVAAQRASGRTVEATGISITAGGVQVSFNGIYLGYPGMEPSGSLTWTENTITYAGVTVNA